MNVPLAPLDHVVVPLLILLSIAEARWYWPRRVRAVAAGVPGARSTIYRFILIAEWTVVVALAAWWASRGRPWGPLRLGAGPPLRFAIGLALAAAYTGLMVAQRRALVARPERLARLMQRLAYVDPLIPATAVEHRLSGAVAITAGLCEEFIYRGFVMWYLAILAGPIVAVLASSLLFGLGHLYQGGRYVLRTGLVGLGFALLALLSGSLWPGILAHAVADLVGLDLGYRARLAAAAAVATSGPGGPEPGPAKQVPEHVPSIAGLRNES
jgi:membrane protease YdiL (CAAX protease family)